ncbi:MAG: PAS domain-containing protein, partial [Pikeienuella sp.]
MKQSDTAQVFNLQHPGNQRMLDYWSQLRGDRLAPFKAEVTARGIGRVLASNTFILENLGDGNLRFRLAGSKLFDIFGLEVRGMSALAIMNEEHRSRFRSLIEESLTNPSTVMCRCEATTPNHESTFIEFVLAPLRSDFDEMDRMIGAVHVLDKDEEELVRAPRRCSIYKAATIAITPAIQPIAGLAEGATPFTRETTPLKPISGGGASSERR